MSCQEVSFVQGTCRLTIEETVGRPTDPRFVAQVNVVSEDHATSRPLVFDDGTRLEIHGDSQAEVENNAISFCEGLFGAFSQTMHACVDFGRPPTDDAPLKLSEVRQQ